MADHIYLTSYYSTYQQWFSSMEEDNKDLHHTGEKLCSSSLFSYQGYVFEEQAPAEYYIWTFFF